MIGIIPVENNDTRAAVSALLTKVMKSGAVDALLVPLRNPAGDAVTPALVKNPALLAEADPLQTRWRDRPPRSCASIPDRRCTIWSMEDKIAA